MVEARRQMPRMTPASEMVGSERPNVGGFPATGNTGFHVNVMEEVRFGVRARKKRRGWELRASPKEEEEELWRLDSVVLE
ncbi:hypothetical protein E2C01_015227 [Portunus trituberculatus]|uniref:Uncharacterized protein n=1 Tax=Portunus trituberculatus TaxID=210409 RepID=A0A5B7DM61_PORTR|nr:hypothetical protein [Portunus trituberculatus]